MQDYSQVQIIDVGDAWLFKPFIPSEMFRQSVSAFEVQSVKVREDNPSRHNLAHEGAWLPKFIGAFVPKQVGVYNITLRWANPGDERFTIESTQLKVHQLNGELVCEKIGYRQALEEFGVTSQPRESVLATSSVVAAKVA